MLDETVTIIGAGPAGLSAAIQLKRYGIAPLIFERDGMGGLLRNANLVENYPGFPGGIPGPELVRRFTEQAGRIGIDVTYETVTLLDEAGGRFRVKTSSRTWTSRIVVIATGTRPLLLTDFEIPARLRECVYYEIHPLLEVEGKRIVIIGSGDAAFDYALNLARKNEVIILNRGEKCNCLPLLWERSRALPQIRCHARTAVSRLSENASGGITLECSAPEGLLRLDADYLIGAIGREPQLDFIDARVLKRVPELENRGTLYRIGDVRNGHSRQTAIAVGDGVSAAMKMVHQLGESQG